MSDVGIGALCFIVFLNTVFVAGVAIGLWMLKRKLDELTQKVDPLADRAGQIMGRVEQLTEVVQRRTEQVLDQTAAVVDSVSRKVDSTTAMAEETISQPLIGAASLVAGISRGLQTYREQGLEKGDSH
jgi:uncharacterized protein YoxC